MPILNNDQWQEALVQLANTGLAITNANVNGQALMLNSAPVAIASDQSNVPVASKNATWTSIYSTTQTGVASWSGSGDLSGLSQYKEIMVNCNLTALTGTSVQFVMDRKDGKSIYYAIWFPTVLTAAGTSFESIGPGLHGNHVFGDIARVRLNVVAITSMTFTVDVQGR